MASQWKKEILSRAGTLFDGKRGPKAEATHEDEDRLYSEIGRLKMELDWLKKSQACKRRGAVGMDRECWRDIAVASMRADQCFPGDRVSAPQSSMPR